MAGRIAPNAWAVTLTTQNLRLNVGNQEVFVAGAGDFFLNCAARPEDPAFDGVRTEPAQYALAQPQCRVRGMLTELAELGTDFSERMRDSFGLQARHPAASRSQGQGTRAVIQQV
jgi:hypothetical protein